MQRRPAPLPVRHRQTSCALLPRLAFLPHRIIHLCWGSSSQVETCRQALWAEQDGRDSLTAPALREARRRLNAQPGPALAGPAHPQGAYLPRARSPVTASGGRHFATSARRTGTGTAANDQPAHSLRHTVLRRQTHVSRAEPEAIMPRSTNSSVSAQQDVVEGVRQRQAGRSDGRGAARDGSVFGRR